jgi:hypothetical protein
MTDFTAFLGDLKTHARIEGDDEDAGLALMLLAAGPDVLNAAGLAMPETLSDIPPDLRFAIVDQAAAYFDRRGPDEGKPGLSLAASRIVARYRGVSLGVSDTTTEETA